MVMGTPDERGRFGDFGGRFVPEALMPACLELEDAFTEAWSDPSFLAEYRQTLAEFVGRPTPVTPLPRLSEKLGVRLFAKREDLAHTGSHKINNVVGQTLLTRRMGKTRIIAETGAGQHGVATATGAARLGLACTVFMGEVDTVRQELVLFSPEFAAKPQIVCANKIDAVDDEERVTALGARAAALGLPFFRISAATGEGLPPLLEAMWQRLASRHAA